MLAVFRAINHWLGLIGGSKIHIYTDSKNITFNSYDFNKKTNRWISEISAYDIEYHHISGTENPIADKLSRLNIMELTSSDNLPICHQPSTENALLKELREFHITNGHPGYTCTLKTLRKLHGDKFPTRLIKHTTIYCHYCQLNKPSYKGFGQLNGKIITTEPLKHLSTDVYGPFDGSEFKHNFKSDKIFLYTITDRCSRFTKCRFTTQIRSCDFLKTLKNDWLKFFKPPETILSDNGLCYTSANTKNELRKMNITQIFTTPYNPTGNAISERINQQITCILRIYKGWNLELLKLVIENRINKIVNTSFNNTPTEIISSHKNNPEFRLNTNKNKTSNFTNKNKKRNKHDYKVGYKIIIKNNPKSKIESPYLGPFEISEIINNKQNIKFINKKGKETKCNIKQVKPYWVCEMSYNLATNDKANCY
ncbi:Transposon Tf2-8 polyprotein [Dictyocoela muelleri]|nr:Transposon Tf2-8 polyprotein [Dictyocoela muelleri]